MSELEQSRENQKQKPHTIPMLVAAIISIIYFLALGFLLTRIQHCPPVYNVTEFEITLTFDWFHQKIHCRSFNELGDFLAGAFAPVAFLWLVAAVFIQSRELAAQRQELKFTRKEVSASVTQLTAQTELFQLEQEDRVRKHNKERCEALFERITKASSGLNWNFSGRYRNDTQGVFTAGKPKKTIKFEESKNIDDLKNGFDQLQKNFVEQEKYWATRSIDLNIIEFPDEELENISSLLENLDQIVSENSDIALNASYPPILLQHVIRVIDEIKSKHIEFQNAYLQQ
ncbi:MAG: hypothetical protein ABJK39_09650 [Hyphomicrobiales bacterium]